MKDAPRPDPGDLRGKTRKELLVLAEEAGLSDFRRLSKEELVLELSARLREAVPAEPVTPAPAGDAAREAAQELERAPVPAPSAEAPPEPVLPADLPTSYGQTRLTLLEVDPHHVYAYWEVTPEDRAAALGGLGAEAGASRWVLRFFDITYLEFDGTNAHGWFDITVEGSAGNWYVDLWADEKTYCAELGPVGPGGRFVAVCRSNTVHTPRSTPSPRYEPHWVQVDPVTRAIEAVAEPPASPAPAVAALGESAGGRGAPEGSAAAAVASLPEPPRASVPGAPPEAEAPGAAASLPDPRRAPAPEGLLRALPEPFSSGMPAALGPAPSEEEIRQHYEHLSVAGPAASEAPPAPGPEGGAPPAPVLPVMPPPGASAPVIPLPTPADLQGVPGSFSGSSGAPPGPSGPSVDLELSAEVIIYGRAQPGQTLQVNGTWVKVNPDGTFRVHWALPRRNGRE